MSDIADLTSVSRTISVQAPADMVFQALTRQDALERWFAEHVAIDARQGGRFAFWGRHTFDGADPSVANQSIEHFDPPRSITIRWNLKGIGTLLTFDVQPGGVRATHQLPGNTDRHLYWLALDGIEIYLYNLRAYVDGGAPLCLPEYSGLSDTMTLDIAIHATPGDVFTALTEPRVMDRWLSTSATVDLRPGGSYSYGWTDDIAGSEEPAGPTTLLDVEEGRRIVHDWTWAGEELTQVSWEVSGSGGSTTVTLTHSGFGPKADMPGYVQGWTSFLCKLKSMLEGLPMPIKVDLTLSQ